MNQSSSSYAYYVDAISRLTPSRYRNYDQSKTSGACINSPSCVCMCVFCIRNCGKRIINRSTNTTVHTTQNYKHDRAAHDAPRRCATSTRPTNTTRHDTRQSVIDDIRGSSLAVDALTRCEAAVCLFYALHLELMEMSLGRAMTSRTTTTTTNDNATSKKCLERVAHSLAGCSKEGMPAA